MPTIFEAPTPNTSGQAKSKSSSKKGAKPMVNTPIDTGTKSMGPLTCFAVSPQSVRFETQEAEETVELFLRQHIVVNVPWIIVTILLILAPSVLFPFVLHFLPIPVDVPVQYVIVGTVFWYLATFGFALGNFLYWFFNIYIVTNDRVVDIDFLYLLYKRFSEAELEKIQDISYTSGGILAAIFDYGDVVIETAGEAPNIEFEKVPCPDRVVETVRRLTEGLGVHV